MKALRWHAVLAASLLLPAALAACDDLPGRAEPSARASEGSATPPPAASDVQASPLDGRALVEKLECNRCHAGTNLPEVPQAKHCFSCHVDIAEGKLPETAKAADAANVPKLLASWKPRVVHLRFTPSLAGVGAIVRPEWVARYLLAPHDLRPGLHPTMPRLPIDDREAASIASYLASAAAPSPELKREVGDIGRGRELFSQKGCAGCHVFTGARTEPPPPVEPADGPDRALAPDLRYARDRLVHARVADWILDPPSIKPGAAMPKQRLSRQEAIDLATFVLDAPLDAPPAKLAASRLPILDREVGYDEVAEKVLHKICWHCHAQPDFARGDGGPGNTGGLGFAGKRVDLSTYEAIASGYVGTDGARASLFSPATTGEPVLLAVLLERQREEQRGTYGPLRGMPLGLPPLSPEDIQLVETWIAKGHPR